MRKINKKEFDCHFGHYTLVLEKIVELTVLSELKGKDECRKVGYDAILDLMSTYWHLAQDFRPLKYYYTWLRKELSYIDDIFESLEIEYKGKELKKVRNLHGRWLLAAIKNNVGPELEEIRKGTPEYKFYKKMEQKGESIIKK